MIVRIGLVDVDGHNFPNLALMKISAWHKRNGDTVEWYDPLLGGHYDKVYMSKVFSFTPDYPYFINADEVEKGGSGYCITVGEDGKEHFDKTKDRHLPDEVEHSYPDYSLYGVTDTAYGFLTRGCPRGCGFCIVGEKEGRCSIKNADLSEFWNGQPKISLLDPNFFACKDWRDLARQLIESGAEVDFNQGLDIRIMTEEMADAIGKMKIKDVHFAWDRYQDKDRILPRLKMFKERSGMRDRDIVVYTLVGFDTTMEQNIDRANSLRGIAEPYTMIYEKYKLPKNHELKRFQRWTNNRIIWHSCDTFAEYMKKEGI